MYAITYYPFFLRWIHSRTSFHVHPFNYILSRTSFPIHPFKIFFLVHPFTDNLIRTSLHPHVYHIFSNSTIDIQIENMSLETVVNFTCFQQQRDGGQSGYEGSASGTRERQVRKFLRRHVFGYCWIKFRVIIYFDVFQRWRRVSEKANLQRTYREGQLLSVCLNRIFVDCIVYIHLVYMFWNIYMWN